MKQFYRIWSASQLRSVGELRHYFPSVVNLNTFGEFVFLRSFPNPEGELQISLCLEIWFSEMRPLQPLSVMCSRIQKFQSDHRIYLIFFIWRHKINFQVKTAQPSLSSYSLLEFWQFNSLKLSLERINVIEIFDVNIMGIIKINSFSRILVKD